MYKFNIDMNKYDPNYIIQNMDESNIDISLISVNIPTPDLLDPELRSDGAIICNNYIAETCSAYPNRFYGLANIAPNDKNFLNELTRCLTEFNLFKGVFISSHIGGENIDNEEYQRLYHYIEQYHLLTPQDLF